MPQRWLHGGYRSLWLNLTRVACGVCMILASASPVQAHSPVLEAASGATSGSPSVWTLNVYYDPGVRWQDPDKTACTAAATVSMLNLILHDTGGVGTLHAGSGEADMVWKWDTSFAKQTEILLWSRKNMTMVRYYAGTDPHGWRNSLNYYGWGSLDAGVYRDATFTSFDQAATAAVKSLALTRKPVGILGWWGMHAQYITGYQVAGEDPRLGNNFIVQGVYVTDPLRNDRARNRYVSYEDWRHGNVGYRFNPYWQYGSPFKDPIDGLVGDKEWRGNWVIVEAVR
jgi:hypothetical protein